MDKTVALPKESIDDNRCSLCGNILSVPPIVMISSDVETYRCGRCKDVACATYSRITLFENVAQFLSFPCTYKDCKQNVPWGLVKAHEEICSYRTIRCPVYYQQCEHDVVVENIEVHFKQKHRANIKNFGQVWNLNVGFDYIYLVNVENLHFLVYILHLNNLSSIGVFSLEPLDKLVKYTVKLSSTGEDEFFVAYENQNIIPFNERQHCYKCMRQLCPLRHHPFSKDNKKKDINVDDFTKKFNNDLLKMISGTKGDIKYTINLKSGKSEAKNETSKTKTASATETDNGQFSNEVTSQSKSDLFRKSFECPICEEYLVSPIYTCNIGHTICNLCRPRLKECPVCKGQLGETRNFTLELMTENVKLHCQYHDNGCAFTGTTEQLYKHEVDCSQKPKKFNTFSV